MYRYSACLLAFVAAGSAFAQIVLTDGNSAASLDPTSQSFPFLRGLNSWEVDEVNQVFQQWYWFRIGQERERSIDTIGTPEVTQTAPNAVNIAYANDRLALDITFTLIGGTFGSRTSDIGEIVRVRNLTNESLDFHLFEYDDFDASGTFGDDSAVLLNSSTARIFDFATRIDVGAVAIPDRWQISAVPEIFDVLEDGAASNLSNSTTFGGPGDLSFAFQWDREISAGGTFLMSKNKLVTPVPEPATIAAIGAGLAFYWARRRGRKGGP